MPRRTRASNLGVPLSTSRPSPPDTFAENLLLLRRQWKWAAFSQFFCTFSPLFAMNDVTVSDIERDLVYQTDVVISRIMQRLLYTLSYDRKVTIHNWQAALRKQYIKRDPLANPFEPHIKPDEPQVKVDDGTTKMLESYSTYAEENDEKFLENSRSYPEELSDSNRSNAGNRTHDSDAEGATEETGQEDSTDWFDLPMLVKLESMHTLAEWQFQNATRLRTIMKSDDELASWRIEPIGYDSKCNAYWFIGGDRLWIQRVPPKLVKSRSLKRKRTGDMSTETSSKKASTSKRARLELIVHSPDQKRVVNDAPNSVRQSRVAKDQAKLKLDLQARELAKLNHEAGVLNGKFKSRRIASNTQPRQRIIGTRTSARLRGTQEIEWQPIPDEWLEDAQTARRGLTPSVARTGLESDLESSSDLTDLSEEVEDGRNLTSEVSNPKPAAEDKNSRHLHVNSHEEDEKKGVPCTSADFVEWETICVSLQEWEHIATRFEKANHYAEKALHKLLVNDIVPVVTQELKDIQRKREIEEALVHRKRSSRIALKESEREEARLAAKKKQEEEEKQSRTRRLEARMQKEEIERIKRESAREQRRRDREARGESRKASVAPEINQGPHTGIQRQALPSNNMQRKAHKDNNGSPRAVVNDNWELSCEICQRHGFNLDDGTPMMSCGRCSKWQHIFCHDRADRAAGRPPRNWDSVDFICKKCHTLRQDNHNGRITSSGEHRSIAHGSQQQSSRPSQPVMVSSTDYGYSYNPTFREPNHQSFYIRPANGQPVSSGFQATYAPNNAPRSSMSFSHYQPAAHNFSGHKLNPEPHPLYSHASSQFHSSSQSYKAQTFGPIWNNSMPLRSPDFPYPPNGYSATPGPLSRSGERTATEHTPQPLHQYSETRYAPAQYLSTQFKHQSASYQHPLDRQ